MLFYTICLVVHLVIAACGPVVTNVHPTPTPTTVEPTPIVPTYSPTSLPTPATTPTVTPTASAGRTVPNVYITFYGFDDNDDGNGNYGTAVISDPGLHNKATEDIGTYQKPSTFATDYRIASPGEIIYVPRLQKYYIMEDTCVECTQDQRQGKLRIDLYMGGNTALQGLPLQQCEEALTADPYTDQVVFDPSPYLPVDTQLLFSNGTCHD